MINCPEEIIQNWCNEVNKPCSIIKDRHNKLITLYTHNLSIFIGKQRNTFIKYRELLNEIGWNVKLQGLTETFTPGNDYRELHNKAMQQCFEFFELVGLI